ncbi:MAG: response regulator [Acidobacteriota bacterium]
MKKDNPTIMIIESRTSEMTSGLLQQRGYRVIEEESLGQAVEDVMDFTSRNCPDVILLDLNQLCPDESWMVHILRSGAQKPNMPIIGMAESDEAAAQQTTNTMGCNRFFSRPNGIGQLTTMIDDLLSQAV